MANYIKIEATGGGARGTGLWKMLFYDTSGKLIPLTFENVILYTANSRTSAENISSMFMPDSSIAPPYVEGKTIPLMYVIKIDEKYDVSKVSILNWSNNLYHAGFINISVSKDNVNYTTVESKNVEYNTYYDFNFPRKKILLESNNKTYSIKITEILYETKMTSNNAPSPFVASASSVGNSSYSAWKAFNGTNTNVSDCWVTANGMVTGWIQLDFGTQTPVNKIFITSRNYTDGGTSAPKNFNIEGSNDNINYNVIQTFIDINDWKANETKEFSIEDSNYRFYRLRVLANNGNGIQVAIGKLEFHYGKSDLIELSELNERNFKEYGATSSVKFDDVITNKNYILQDTISENADGLWVQEINRKPLSMKFE